MGCYNYLLKPVPLRKVFLWTSLLGTALGLSQLLLITGKAPVSCSSSAVGLCCLLGSHHCRFGAFGCAEC